MLEMLVGLFRSLQTVHMYMEWVFFRSPSSQLAHRGWDLFSWSSLSRVFKVPLRDQA